MIDLIDSAGVGLVFKQQPHYSLMAILKSPDQACLFFLQREESVIVRTLIRNAAWGKSSDTVWIGGDRGVQCRLKQ